MFIESTARNGRAVLEPPTVWSGLTVNPSTTVAAIAGYAKAGSQGTWDLSKLVANKITEEV